MHRYRVIANWNKKINIQMERIDLGGWDYVSSTISYVTIVLSSLINKYVTLGGWSSTLA